MLPLYVPATSTVIVEYFQRYTHPITDIVYGGTDFDNPVKLAEIGAVPLRALTPAAGLEIVEWVVEDDSENPGGKQYRPVMLRVDQLPHGFHAETWEIVDDVANPGDKLKRPVSPSPWDATMFNAYKEEKQAAIDKRTAELIGAGFTFGGHRFSLSPQAQQNIVGLVKPIELGWVTFPHSMSTVESASPEYLVADAATFNLLYQTAVGTIKVHMDSGRTLKKYVANCSTLAEVDAIEDTR